MNNWHFIYFLNLSLLQKKKRKGKKIGYVGGKRRERHFAQKSGVMSSYYPQGKLKGNFFFF